MTRVRLGWAAVVVATTGLALSIARVHGQPPVRARVPSADQLARFAAQVDRVGEESVRRAELEARRREAPFDLDWGLR